NVLACLNEALGPAESCFGHTTMLFGFLVERGGDDLGGGASDFLAHVGDFFGTLVDEQDEEVTFRMIAEDAGGELLQEDGLAGARRSDDETTLSFADRCQQIDDAHGDVAFLELGLRWTVVEAKAHSLLDDPKADKETAKQTLNERYDLMREVLEKSPMAL